MNYDYILEHNGYGKLAEYLPETDKRFLAGYKAAIDDLELYKENIADDIDNDCETIAKIEEEIATCALDNAINSLETEMKGITIGFVDMNHYSIDIDGEIYDDNDEETNLKQTNENLS